MSTKSMLQEQYRTILDSITDGVFTVDLDWQITFFNRAAEIITGISKFEAMGQPCFEVFRADVCETGCVLRQTMETKSPINNMPIFIYRADKRRIPISVSTTLLKDAAGKIIGGVEVFRDLSRIKTLQKAVRRQHRFDDIVSKSPRMQKLMGLLPLMAESSATVLIEGASGTGKELMARAIHNHSRNKNGPFIPVNCGALPDSLIESELFGYKAGAFTDAKQDKPGRFALARNGTIFLDEVGDISPAVQIRLLRVLQEKVFEPLGSTRSVATNARVIAATHRNLEKRVKEGTFREDLYYRINVVKLSLPKLVERKEDIPLLVDHFIDRFNSEKDRDIRGVTAEAMAALLGHAWPGNIRELENAVEHAFVISRSALIDLHDLPEHLLPARDAVRTSARLSLKEIEKQAIISALERNNWRRMATARELKIDKNTLRRKIQRLGIGER